MKRKRPRANPHIHEGTGVITAAGERLQGCTRGSMGEPPVDAGWTRTCVPMGLRPPHGPVSSPRACAPQHWVLVPQRLSAHRSPARTREGGARQPPHGASGPGQAPSGCGGQTGTQTRSSAGQRRWPRTARGHTCRSSSLASFPGKHHLTPRSSGSLNGGAVLGVMFFPLLEVNPPGPRPPWCVLQSVLRGTSQSTPGASCFLPSSRGPWGGLHSSAPPVPPCQPPWGLR